MRKLSFGRAVRISFLMALLLGALAYYATSHEVFQTTLGPVLVNCHNPSAWGYAEVGDELGRVNYWAHVNVGGLEPRQNYEVIVFRSISPRPMVIGQFRTDIYGNAEFHAQNLPLRRFDVVNVRLPAQRGSAVLTSRNKPGFALTAG